jgi:hypothetical protein
MQPAYDELFEMVQLSAFENCHKAKQVVVF